MNIGLIGNMNNNNFALMRYFRDLGADAHLLLYANDGEGGLSHFKPECDTWAIDKWKCYIHKTDIQNTLISAFDFPVSHILSFKSLIMYFLGKNFFWQRAISQRKIIETYHSYDRLVASGITPANLLRVGRSLDIFYPYAAGVEFLGTGEFLVRFKGGLGINRLFLNYVLRRQAIGIQSAKNVVTGELSLSIDIFKGIGVEPIVLQMPMVYDGEIVPKLPPTKTLQDAWDAIKDVQFTLLHQSRLLWVNPGNYSSDAWRKENKNNDLLLYAFAEFLSIRPTINSRLLIVDYGPDVASTKRLAVELGIDRHLYWLPRIERRELMWLLSRVSVGVGEFYDLPRMIWGGTGWETLASGKPLLQGFNFEEGEFDRMYGYPPPPMLAVRNREDILKHLIDMSDSPRKQDEIGRGAKAWFSRYNGIGLAKRWLDLTIGSREVEMQQVAGRNYGDWL
jgi:hypothetical protein